MLSAARIASLIAGLLLIISAILGSAPLALGLILGVGVMLLSGRIKHRLWSGILLVVGLVVYSVVGGLAGEGGAVLLIAASALGLASTLL